MADKKYVALTEAEIEIIKNSADTELYDNAVCYDLLWNFLRKNGIRFEITSARNKNSVCVKNGCKYSVLNSSADNIYETSYPVFDEKNGWFADMFVGVRSLYLIDTMHKWDKDTPVADLSQAWIQTQYMYYGEAYLDLAKKVVSDKKDRLKKEINHLDSTLAFIEDLQSGSVKRNL